MRLKNQLVGFLFLSLTLGAGLAFGQDKTEQPPVTSSRSFQLSGYTQLSYAFYDKGVDTFSIRRARLTFSGEIVKNFRFRLQVDGTKSPMLVDAQLDIDVKPYLGFRIGQFYLPFGLETRTSDSELDTILRTQVSDSLAPGRDIGAQGRDVGAMVLGKYSMVEYMAGVFNGAGVNKLDNNKEKDLSARLVLHPTKSLAVGGSIYSGRYSATEGTPPVTRDRAGLEAVLTVGRFLLKSEYISGKDAQVSKSGWYFQGLYNIIPKKLQAVARWDTYDKNRDVSLDRNDTLTLGGTWFLSEKTKVLVNYALYRKEGEGTTNQALIFQFQAGF
jgi:phosphate-selective porin